MGKALLIAFFVCTFIKFSLGNTDRFYTKKDGLAGTYFHCLLQDSKGYLWVCTKSGLNRFNGYSFDVYQFDASDSTSINSTTTTAAFEDHKGRIWIGTNWGLNLYNPQQNCFDRIKFVSNTIQFNPTIRTILQNSSDYLYLVTSNGLVRFNPETRKQEFFNLRFETNGIPSFTQFNGGLIDPEGNIWIVTSNDGIIVFDTKTDKFLTLSEYTHSNIKIPANNYFAIDMTSKGEFIFGAQKGDILLYDFYKNQLSTIPFATDKQKQLSGGIISIVTDRHGTTWLGTEYNGIKILDTTNKKIKDGNYLLKVENAEKSNVFCYEDRKGDLWFAVNYQGLYHKTQSFYPFKSVYPTENKLSNHLVKSILRDRNGNLWLGTDGGGLNFIPEKSLETSLKINSIPNLTEMKGQAIMCLHEDKRGWIWIGTYLNGLYCYRGVQAGFKHYPISTVDENKSLNFIFDIEEDKQGNLWIATNGSGLFYLDVSCEKVIPVNHDYNGNGIASLPNHLNDILIDSDSTLWLATYNGLLSWNKKTNTLSDLTLTFSELTHETINKIELGPDNKILIGAFSGFYIYDKNKDTLIKYTDQNGLPSNSVMAIQIDQKGIYWLSTSNGISRFNPQTQTFKNYFSYDGLPCDEYLLHSGYKDAAGIIYFGGVNGMVSFQPDSILDRKEKPGLIFTDFKILNQGLKKGTLPNGRKVLHKVINETDTIRLRYSDKSFSVEFAAIDFSVPEKIKYAVMMEGFDKNWIIKNYKQRYANYTNLNPGTYILKVKSTNLDGEWIEPARQIYIIIAAPFWLRWWAFLIYIALVTVVFYYIRSISLFRIKMKNNLQIEQLERQKQQSINQAKFQFFTNISHEIRTPLSMLLAPLHELSQTELTERQKINISFIERNTKRLERLLNQLLEIQKIENSQLLIHAKEINIIGFIREILSLFEANAKDQNVEISFESCCDRLLVWVDPDKMDKILFNLLSNALKFTPSGGLITVTVNNTDYDSINPGSFEIIISDTGKGIGKEHLQKIFERFYQVENNKPHIQVGTGIGLHLTKNLVEIQKGTITVNSTPEQGTTFTIRLPLGNKHLLPEEKSDEKAIEYPELTGIGETEVNANEKSFEGKTKHTILIVEDDTDILNFLEAELSDRYKILKASNGDNGWKLAYESFPDLIISDVMMPGMNGLDLCKKVKSTFETSHIPVVLLTARITIKHEMEGLETGADDYIHKPFNPALLQLKVEKIIESREALRQKFSKTISFTAKEMTVTSPDEKFLQKAMDYVKNNLSDSDFSIEKMCTEIGVSRIYLYRKLKALTNQVPTEFIRTIRLKQAAFLLCQNKMTISEIAYEVGFNSHQYFTNSFQKYYNMSPTEYAAKKIDNTKD